MEPAAEEQKDEEDKAEEERKEEERKAEEKKAEEAKGAKAGKGKAASKEEVKEVVNTMEDQVDDPNALKFVPDVVHFDRTQFSTT